VRRQVSGVVYCELVFITGRCSPVMADIVAVSSGLFILLKCDVFWTHENDKICLALPAVQRGSSVAMFCFVCGCSFQFSCVVSDCERSWIM